MLRAQPAGPEVFAAGQMFGHRALGWGSAWGSHSGLSLPKPLLGTGRQRAKNPNCCSKMILKRALNADTLDTGMYS